MKKVWDKWTRIALVKRILVGLILGAILGIAVPQATGIAILGDVFVSALKAIAPLLVFFLVISSLCNAGKSHGGVIKTGYHSLYVQYSSGSSDRSICEYGISCKDDTCKCSNRYKCTTGYR